MEKTVVKGHNEVQIVKYNSIISRFYCRGFHCLIRYRPHVSNYLNRNESGGKDGTCQWTVLLTYQSCCFTGPKYNIAADKSTRRFIYTAPYAKSSILIKIFRVINRTTEDTSTLLLYA